MDDKVKAYNPVDSFNLMMNIISANNLKVTMQFNDEAEQWGL